jgi:hypothetical protein
MDVLLVPVFVAAALVGMFVVLPLAVGTIAWIDRRAPKAMPRILGVAVVVAVMLALLKALDQPGDVEREIVGLSRNVSGTGYDYAHMRHHIEVALPDGRHISTITDKPLRSFGPYVRVAERRRWITGTPVYDFVSMEEMPPAAQ